MLDLAHIRALWSGDAFQYLGSNKDLLAYTGHHHVVINSFGQPVIQTPDAASIVVEIGDWVFRHNGALHACAHEVWLVIAAARELVPAMADEIARLREHAHICSDLLDANEALGHSLTSARGEIERLRRERDLLLTLADPDLVRARMSEHIAARDASGEAVRAQ